MKFLSYRFLLPLCAWFVSPAGLDAAEIYFGPVTPAEVASALVNNHPDARAGTGASAIKLRVVSGPGLSEASSAGGLRLVQAAISPVTASPQGYATLVDDYLVKGKSALDAASAYRYTQHQGGDSLWNIQFAGVPPKNTPINANFFPDKDSSNPGQPSIAEAMEYARAAIRANPYKTGVDSGYALLFRAAYDNTVPYTWSGNEWRAVAEKDRLGVSESGAADVSANARLQSLENACGQYRKALGPFLAFLNHEVESAWLLDPDAFIGNAGPSWAAEIRDAQQNIQRKGWSWALLLNEAYMEAVTQLSRTQYELLHTRYLSQYAAGNLDLLIQDIRSAASEIDRLMLPVSALHSAGLLDPEIDTGTPSSHSALLHRLADHAVERALFFSAGENPLSGQISFSTYGRDYVPFLVPAQLSSKPFSFDNFLAYTFGVQGDVPPNGSAGSLQGSLIKEAINTDNAARNAIGAVISDSTKLSTLMEQTRDEYEGQLKQLCGQRRDSSGNFVPDILGYLLPADERDQPQQDETLGDIALQWNKITQAETRLLAAHRAVAEIYDEAEIIQEFGDERLKSYARIARIQLSTGEEISALDYLAGEVRATAIRAEAEERANQVKKKSWFSGIAKWAVRGIGAVVTGGTSVALEQAWKVAKGAVEKIADGGLDKVATVIGGVIDHQQSSKSEAEMHRSIGRIHADAARRQADIQAQQTKIRAMEAANITMESQGQEDNRIREAIQKLMIRVERQKLEVLMARQQVEFAELEHANMIGRIASLLEEYRRASLRNTNSLLNRPDVRLVRDYEIQEAARKFRVAQEHAFLCARAARYRFAGPNLSFQNQIDAIEAGLLGAQNAKQLETYVSQLISIRAQFLASINGLPPIHEVRFSLRDIVVQSNSFATAGQRELDGNWKPTLNPELLQGFAGEGDTPALRKELSDEQFVKFLERHLEPEGTGSSYLRLSFPIGFERTYGERVNPLRQATSGQFGHVIVGPGPSYATKAAVGVFLNIRNRSISEVGLPATATLRPVGSFSVTTGPHGASTAPVELNRLRFWNPVERQGEGGSASVRILYNRDTLTSGWANRFDADLATGSGGFQLHERSPANNQWFLEIEATGDKDSGIWQQLLPNLRDIEICMTIQGWTNQN